MPYIFLLTSLALSQGCVSDNPQFARILHSLPSFMLQMGTQTIPPGGNTGYNDLCYTIAVDPQDEGIYCAGGTQSDLAEENGDPTRAAADAFLVKFDRNKKLLWARQFGAITFAGENTLNDSFSDIAFDSRGFVYVSGKTSNQAMVAKFTRKGDLIWRRKITGSRHCRNIAIRRDRIFCSGVSTLGQFVQAYEIDQEGNVLWNIETTGGSEYISDLIFDRAGNLIIAGTTEAILSAGHPLPVPGNGDIFIWKISPAGTEIWLSQIGTASYDEYVGSLALDKSDNILAAGSFEGSGALPPDSDFDPVNQNLSSSNSFLASFRDTGTGITENWNNRTSSNYSYAESVIVTSENEFIVGGVTIGNLFEAGDGSTDVYFSKVSSSGSYIKGVQFGTTTKGRIDNQNNQTCSKLALDPLGNILCGGSTTGHTNETNGGSYDIMIWRLGPDLSF